MRRKKPRPTPDWQAFERLVAGLHATDPRAKVTWNEHIDGRQFDVTIRFSFQDYTYLTVIECKDQRVTPGDVDALVTKASDAHADKAIIVSSRTPQRGAKNVAARHGVHLYTLCELDELPEWVVIRSLSPIISITGITAKVADQTTYEFPRWNNELTYAITHAKLTTSSITETVEAFLESHRKDWEPTLHKEQPQQITLACGPCTTLHVPYEDPITIMSITFQALLTTGKEVDTGGLDINVLTPTYEYRDALANTARTVTKAGIPLGFDTTITPGEFYEDPSTNVRFYVDAIDKDGWVTIHQVESYQHGKLFQLTMRQLLRPPYYVVPITDKKRREKLQRMLDDMKLHQPQQVRAAQASDPCPCGSSKTLRACHGSNAGDRPIMVFKTPGG